MAQRIKDWNQILQEGHENYTVRVDTATTTTTYIGKSFVGTLTSSPKWQIQKLDTTSGVVINWADGDDNFDNVWDNRASLTYR